MKNSNECNYWQNWRIYIYIYIIARHDNNMKKNGINKIRHQKVKNSDTQIKTIAGNLLCFDLLTRLKMPFKVMHQKEVTHSNDSYERKSRGRKLADEMGRGKKKNPMILS